MVETNVDKKSAVGDGHGAVPDPRVDPTVETPKKITLNRQSREQIKVTRQSGKKSTVNVVRKKSRVYVKRDIGAAPEEPENVVVATEPEIEPIIEPVIEPVVEKNAVEVEPSSDQTLAVADESTKPKTKTKSKDNVVEKEKDSKDSKAKNTKSDYKRKKTEIEISEKSLLELDDEIEDESEDATSDKKLAPKPKHKPKAKSKTVYNDDAAETRSILSAKKSVRQRHAFSKPTARVVHEVGVPETITVAELAQKMSVKAAEVIKAAFTMGLKVTINQNLDQDTAVLLVEELGHKAVPLEARDLERDLLGDISVATNIGPRPPVITVMGHVDHGKTSLLDFIRRSKVAASEAGGITQHIGAYHVEVPKGTITFLDTPGHSAFTAMRARGAKCTDIVVLVVAADDGVKPQTIEAIKHAKAANVPLVVAVNKMDKPGADLGKVKEELAQYEVLSEEWSGDTMFVPVSAKTGAGIDALLDAVLLQSEMLELTAPQSGVAQGVVIESRIDKGRGPVASVLVQAGQLKIGDIMLAGQELGRVRAMVNEHGQQVESAGPSMPVEILGLSGTPQAGDEFLVVHDERRAREVVLFRQNRLREQKSARQQASKLEGFMDMMQSARNNNDTGPKVLNLLIKADVQGSAEALCDSLVKLSNEEVTINIVSQGVGGINESDVNLAMASGAVIIGFNVRADASAKRCAQREGITLNYFSIIYDVIDHVTSAIRGLTGPKYKENILGTAVVREVFRSSKIGAIAGCIVLEGTIKRGKPIRVLRNQVVIYEGELESLRRFKDNVNEVKSGTECGIGVKDYNDVNVGDHIEVYERVEVKS